MPNDAPILSVVVVTWNSADTIAACLDSLSASKLPGKIETIVLDNASTDDTQQLIATAYPHVTLVRSAENLGFARANNRAFIQAAAHNILLLNPDVVLQDPNAIAGMLGILQKHPDIAALGPRLIFEDGTHQVGDAGFRPSTLNMIVHGLGIAHLIPSLRTLYLVRPDRIAATLIDIDWICGACLLVRRTAIEDAGPLDERLFLYAEDVEWGCRMRDHGLRLAYLPRVKVTHLQGRSEQQAGAPVSTRWLTSLLSLYERLNGNRWMPPVCGAFAAGFSGRAVIYAILAVARPGKARFYRGRATALREYAKASTSFLKKRSKKLLDP